MKKDNKKGLGFSDPNWCSQTKNERKKREEIIDNK